MSCAVTTAVAPVSLRDELGERGADGARDVLVPLVGDDAADVVGLDDR